MTVAGHGLVVCAANPNLGKELLNFDEVDAESAEAGSEADLLLGHCSALQRQWEKNGK